MKKINRDVRIDGFVWSGTSANSLYVAAEALVGRVLSASSPRTVFRANGRLYAFNDADWTYDGNLATLISKSIAFAPTVSRWASGRKYSTGDVVTDGRSLYVCADNAASTTTAPSDDGGAHWTKIVSGSTGSAAATSIVLTGRAIDAGVSANTPVAYDEVSGTWKKKFVTVSSPVGFYAGTTGEVVLFGKCTTTGLEANNFYFLDPSTGGITKNAFGNSTKIGYAISATEFLVDIDREGTAASFTAHATPSSAKWYALRYTSTAHIARWINFSDNTTFSVWSTGINWSVPMWAFNSQFKWYWNLTNAPSTSLAWMDFATQTPGTVAWVTMAARSSSMSPVWLNSLTKWYLAWWYWSWTPLNEIDWIDLSTEVYNNPAATLSVARWRWAWVWNELKWYVMWGVTQASASAEIDWIAYSTETAINPSAGATWTRYLWYHGNSSTNGYHTMGQGATSWRKLSEKFRFSTETVTTLWRILGTFLTDGASSNSYSHLYMMGWTSNDATRTAAISMLAFDTDTGSTTAYTLPAGPTLRSGAGFQSGGIL